MKNPYLIRLKKYIFLLDLLLLNLSIAIGHYIIFHDSPPNLSSKLFILLANLSWCIIAAINKNHEIRQQFNVNEIADKFLVTFIYQSLLLLSAIYFFKILNISRGFVIITLGTFCVITVIQKLLLVYFLKSPYAKKNLQKKVLIVGNSTIADSLAIAFADNPELGYANYEFVEEVEGADLIEIITAKRTVSQDLNEIFICYKEMNLELLDKLIVFGNQKSMLIKVVFDSISNKKNRFRYHQLPILHLDAANKTSLKIKIIKRSFDILFASFLMLVGAPVFLLLYLITKTTSKGNAFYKQERIGKNGKPFHIYKFRSMYVNAEKLGPQLSKDNDPRITTWGRFMRKTRLDELPQFWNVIKGDMSIVGYRPERKHYIDEISKKTPEYKIMLDHKPGITSLGQVHYGYAENVDQMCERLKYDLLYFRNINLNSDFNIILKTVKVMVQGKGK